MKRFLKFIALAGLIGIAAVACKKTPEEQKEPEKPGTLTAPTLTVSPASIVVSESSEEIALTFSWNDVATKDITPVYAFQITKKGDSEFSSGTAFECSTTEKKFSHAELVSLAGEIGASVDEGFSLIARVRVTAKDNKDIAAVLSNVVEASVSKEQYAINNLYPIGNGTPYGWSQDKTEAMAKSGSTFTWTGHLYANADIKFLLQNDGNWWPGIVNKSDDPYKYEPVIGFSDAEDKKFKVDKEGKYTITIDAANTNALKIKFEFIDDDIQQLVVDHLYILGGATKTGWSLDAMEEFAKNGNVFTWEGSLEADGEFRFPMQRDWWPCLMIAMDGKTLVKGVSDDEKTGFVVNETGIWEIICDIDKMEATLTYKGEIAPPAFPTLYMCGDATPYGWSTVMTDENQLKPVDPSNVNVLSWTGQLTEGGLFKFLTKADWIPSYNRDATASDYWTLVYRATYDDPDEQFSVSETGNYKVVVDLDAMKVSCTKEEIVDTFDYTPSAAYNAAGNLWKAADAAGVEFFYYLNPNWAGEVYNNVASTECPYVEFKQSTYKLTQEYATSSRWENQFYIHPYGEANWIALEAAKTYKFSITLQSTASFGAFFKLSKYNPDGGPKYEGEAIWESPGYPDNIVFEADKPLVFEHEFSGVEAPNVNIIFDFGGAPQGTIVYIKDIILSEVAEEVPVDIAIDGDMSDWNAVSTSLVSEEGPYLVFKAAYDDEFIYLYSKRTWHDGLWKDSSGGYYYYEFDTDNNPATGLVGDDVVNGNKGFGVEAWMYLYLFTGTKDAPTFASNPAGSGYPSSAVMANVLAAGATDMEFIETEVRIPRADIGVTAAGPIRIFTWGNKSASNLKAEDSYLVLDIK